tara:strand:- start:81 stop:809 length:729 start_codon:yes stop_codon:yes gene_type:complete
MKFTKEYRKIWNAQHYLKNKEKISKKHKEWREKNKEKQNARQRQYYLENKEKINQKVKEYYHKNWHKVQEQHRKYKENNEEKLKKHYYSESNQKRLKKYREKNKERSKKIRQERDKKNRKKLNKYTRDRKKNNPSIRIRHQLSNRLWSALKRNNLYQNKCASTMQLVGCTIEELWKHLESSSSWEPWMTRENYGKGGWDVDHILPCASFDLKCPVQQLACFHWSNLQPLEHIKNVTKGSKIL